uniref:Putative defensin n=1 Tax=Nicotiana megalosiphon TaxID=118703 RepID=C5IJZ0_9SOLA|nr:putative defensin [Nicotiana megalosiphon]
MDRVALVSLCFVYLVLFVAQEIVVTEARECKAQGRHGTCFRDANCVQVCEKQAGWSHGDCRAQFKCKCIFEC